MGDASRAMPVRKGVSLVAGHLTTTREQEQPSRRLSGVRSRRSHVGALLFLLFATTLSPCDATPPPVTHRPIADLNLEIRLDNEYTGRDTPAMLSVEMRLLESGSLTPIAPRVGAHFTCNGVDVTATESLQTASFCPAQPPGGMYQFVYTDDLGATTIVHLPVPLGEVTLRAPAPNRPVPIPLARFFTLQVAVPTVPATGNVTIDYVTVWCGEKGQLGRCGGVQASPQNVVSTSQNPPTVGVPHTSAPLDRYATTSPTPGGTSVQGVTPTVSNAPSAASDATATISGNESLIQFRSDFSQFTPGPGQIDVIATVQVFPNPSGFHRVTATFSETLSASVTWVH